MLDDGEKDAYVKSEFSNGYIFGVKRHFLNLFMQKSYKRELISNLCNR